jgi:hypothetical protein
MSGKDLTTAGFKPSNIVALIFIPTIVSMNAKY